MKHRICNRPGTRIARPSSMRLVPWGSIVGRPKFVLALGLAIVFFAGCFSSDGNKPPVYVIEKPGRPSHILVQDFAVSPSEIPIDAPIGARLGSGRAASSEQLARDRKLGTNMAAQLITALREMGLSAERFEPGVSPPVNDVVVRGCFASKHGTNAPKLLTVGFDFDALELLTMVEPYQVTSLGVQHGLVTSNNPSGIIATSGMRIGDKADLRDRLDGWATKTVKEIAESLKIVFQEQGWIN